MKRRDDRLLPVLLLCAQAVVWPGAALVRGDVPAGSVLLVAALVAGSVTAVLLLRRTRPVITLVLVAAACALGAGPLPAGATAVLGTAGVALALFTVATERDTFTAVLCVVTLALWQLLYGITLHGISERDGLDLVLTALLYATTCGAGLFLRRARRVRRSSQQLLNRAESERHRLPAVERRRMERELHDVSAHHLTAVVVTAGAALGLRDRRPELGDEALRFAVDTGHEVTRALGAVRAPAPSGEDLPSPEERLLDLVAGFRRLGQRVDCEIDPLPDGAVADAAYGIVREALTNAARYAPGATVRVLCRYGDDRTDVVVTSGAPLPGTPAHGAGLGGGRGQGFLRSRAREAGGTLTTGPTAEGGWEVRAELPGRGAAPVERSGPRGYRAAQVTAAVLLVLQPMLPALVIRAESIPTGSQVSAGVLFALLAAAQAVTLLWLRRAPRTTHGVLFALAALWPVAMAAGDYDGPVVLPPALSILATCAALAAHTTLPPSAHHPRAWGGGVAEGRPRVPGGAAAEDDPRAPQDDAPGDPPRVSGGRAAGDRPRVWGGGVAGGRPRVPGGAAAEDDPRAPQDDVPGDRPRVPVEPAAGDRPRVWGGGVAGGRVRALVGRAAGYRRRAFGVGAEGGRTRALGAEAAGDGPRVPFGRAAGNRPRACDRRAAGHRSPVFLTVAAAAVHAAALSVAVLDRGTTVPGWAVVAGATAGAALAAGGARWYGAVRGRRERAARGSRDRRLAAWTEEAVRDAWAERRRIAGGLETTVLARTADMVAEAEAGRLDATAERAREALAAMRALLDTVREGEAERELRPQPTLQALDLLARQCRATGREVRIRLTDRVPDHLPTAVDLAAYHAAETLLATGDDQPAVLELDTAEDTLTITATGIAPAAHPAVRERLAARLAVLEGTLTTGPADTVRLRLPLTAGGGKERER
ncbi:histidine kinase [Streptomyces sp. NPDC001273]|uniref:ATP-binding protein n=1 Tax=unclassified Streptomyces TaxID=2593676 RepID=UPI00340D19EA